MYLIGTEVGFLAAPLNLVPASSGIILPLENLNADRTRGFEVAITYNKKIGGLNLGISPNLAYSNVKYLQLVQSSPNSAVDNYFNNSSYRNANTTWGYKAIGQFQSQAEIASSPVQDGNANQTLLPGDIKYADLNHDGCY